MTDMCPLLLNDTFEYSKKKNEVGNLSTVILMRKSQHLKREHRIHVELFVTIHSTPFSVDTKYYMRCTCETTRVYLCRAECQGLYIYIGDISCEARVNHSDSLVCYTLRCSGFAQRNLLI